MLAKQQQERAQQQQELDGQLRRIRDLEVQQASLQQELSFAHGEIYRLQNLKPVVHTIVEREVSEGVPLNYVYSQPVTYQQYRNVG